MKVATKNFTRWNFFKVSHQKEVLVKKQFEMALLHFGSVELSLESHVSLEVGQYRAFCTATDSLQPLTRVQQMLNRPIFTALSDDFFFFKKKN